MKQKIRIIAAAAISLALSAAFAMALLAYTQPIGDTEYDFSMMWKSEAMPDDWIYDDKGWTVFTQEDGTVTELNPNGIGGFSGPIYPGQTFYFSRTMVESLDSPVLRISTANRCIAVFLDNELFYTDCPNLENRIGRLTLPTMKEYREKPVLVTLPLDYIGKTLTIAQSTSLDDMESQKTDNTVWPCAVTLSHGYSYESSLIAESFRTAIPATLAFFAGLLFLAAFIWQTIQKNVNGELLCAALTLFLYLASKISSSSYFGNYFTALSNLYDLCRMASLAVLLVFLSLRAGKKKFALCALTALYCISVGICLLIDLHTSIMNDPLIFFRLTLPQILGLLGLLAALLCGFIFWWKESRFYRLFLSLILAEAAVYGILLLLGINTRTFCEQLIIAISEASFGYFLWQLWGGMMFAAIISASAEWIKNEWSRQTDIRLMAQHGRLTQKSYRNIQRQHEKIMMIRHDMAKHLNLLRQMIGEGPAADYLDNLIGQNKKIHSVIQSGNETLDLILNGTLADIVDSEVNLQILNARAPKTLPLTDADLCSLITNIADNAAASVLTPGIQQPYVKLDMHVSNNFFVFTCENTAIPKDSAEKKRPSTSVRIDTPHGLGLKIIQQIANRYNALLETEQGADYYRVTLALPLGHV